MRLRSSAGDEGYDDVCGVAVEVLAASVVDRCLPGVGAAGSGINIAQRDSGIECAIVNVARSMWG